VISDARKHDARTFAIGALCGFLVGVIVLSLALDKYSRAAALASIRTVPGAVDGLDQGVGAIDGPHTPGPTGTGGAAAAPTNDGPVLEPAPGDVGELTRRHLSVPVEGVRTDQLARSFDERRGGGTRPHEAIDILAARNTPVLAVEGGTIARLFLSKAGGITVYQFDPSGRYCYYYAHLERYADGLKEGGAVTRGQVLGYVGTSGNAPKNTPHLHFAVFRLTADRHWWEGTALDPYDILR